MKDYGPDHDDWAFEVTFWMAVVVAILGVLGVFN